MLGEATEVEFVASYMDTWIIQTSELLQGIFTRGGTVRAILPKPESDAAIRVLERFPEYTPELVRHKIINTAQRLNMMAWQSGNNRAKSEIYWITGRTQPRRDRSRPQAREASGTPRRIDAGENRPRP